MRAVAPAVVFFIVAGLVPLVVRDAFLLDGLVLILIWGASAAAWNVAGGYAGQVSLGHSAFFGLGAYAAALLGTRWGVSPWLGLVVGALVATIVGLVIGYLSNRLRGPYFVLATIAFSQVLLIVGSRWRGFTAGSEGIPVPFRPGFWTLGIADKRVWVWIVLALAVIVYLVELYLERSRRGYQLAAVREDEDAALSLGVPARQLKVAAIAVSAALTAACGALWAQYVGFVDPFYVFSVDLSVRFALAAIIGGLGTALGPFLGSLLVTTLETYLRAQFGGIGAGLVGIYLIIYGIILILVVRFVPEGLTVIGDPAKLHDALRNLLENAINYSPDAGTIILGAHRHQDRVVITVIDQGPGIPAADVDRVFERFYRADKARSRGGKDPGGTGLGLAIVKHLVELHGGKASAANRPQGGAVITLSLPAA